MKNQKHFLICFVFYCLTLPIAAQITVTTQSPANAASVVLNSFLAPNGVSGVQNVTYNGVPGSFATFTGTSNIGFNSGIILSNDRANLIPYPASNQIEGPWYWSNYWDQQLQLLAGDSVRDVAILQFDFQPLTDTIKFRYVFGSEEYPERRSR